MASPCSYHLKGYCKFGAKCRNSHSAAAIRPSHSAQTNVLCLFREPLPAGKVEIEFPNIECVAEAHVLENDRRIVEIKVDTPKQGMWQGVWQTFTQTAKKAFRGKSDHSIGMAVLLIPAG